MANASRRFVLTAALTGAVLGRPAHAAADNLDIPLEGGTLAAYRAQPDGAGPFPCVVVVGTAAGLPAWITDICRRLAGQGYLALAVDVWAADAADDTVLRRLGAAFDWAKQNAADPAKLALAGYGRGGRIAWLYAAQDGSLKAAVAWGGAVSGATPSASPKTPLDVAAQLKAPLLGLYGKEDASNPRATLLKTEAASKHQAELVVYDGAGAEFAAEGQPGYDAAAALDGWNRMLAWFKRHGVA